MAFRAGTTTFVMIDGVNGAGTNVSPWADNVAWPQTVQSLDVSTFGTAAKAMIVGLTDGDVVTMSGPLDVSLFSQLAAVKAAQSAGSSTSTLLWGPGGSVSGQVKVQAECWLTALSVNTSASGRVEYSASLQVTGAVTNGTF